MVFELAVVAGVVFRFGRLVGGDLVLILVNSVAYFFISLFVVIVFLLLI